MNTDSVSATSCAQDAVDRAWQLQFIDLDQARKTADDAVHLARAEGNLSALGQACFQTAYAAIRRSAPAEAVAAIEEALSVFTGLEDARGLWLAHIAAALHFRSIGKTADAVEALVALERSPPLKATASDFFILHTALGMSYRFVGQLEPALKWHYQALDSARVSGEPQLIAAALCNLGGYHADLYNPEEACRLLEQALEWSTSCSAHRTTVIIAINLVQSCTAQGLHDRALGFAEAYLKHDQTVTADGYADLSANLTLALAYANVQRVKDAVQVFARTEGHGVTPADEGTPQVFWTYVKARVELVSGRPAAAIAAAHSLFSEIDEAAVNSPADLMHLHAAVAEAYESLGDGFQALFHERRRATIREGLVRRAMQAASVTHMIRSELEATRTERDRIREQHEELELEHEKLAVLNAALNLQIAENVRLHDELREQNYRDALTGLNNRRFFYEHAPALLEFNLRSGVPLCLAMLDVDFFKKINDSYGHSVGDHVLAGLGKLLRNSLREHDIVCRVGGEEFAMILPACHSFAARDRLQGVLFSFGQMKARAGELELPLDLAFSAGIVEFPENGTSIDDLLIAADRLLYKAKNAGRARIEIAANEIRIMDKLCGVACEGSDETTLKTRFVQRRH